MAKDIRKRVHILPLSEVLPGQVESFRTMQTKRQKAGEVPVRQDL
jgi:hypothetical protein